MTKKSDRLREEIAKTKADLSIKLSVLESQVRHDVGGAKESLDGAIENVRSTARFFSFSHQVQERPLLMTGASMFTGLVFTRWLLGESPRVPYRAEAPYRERVAIGAPLYRAITENYPNEVRLAKSMAFGLLLNFVAERAKAGLPHMVETITAFEKRLKAELAKKK